MVAVTGELTDWCKMASLNCPLDCAGCQLALAID